MTFIWLSQISLNKSLAQLMAERCQCRDLELLMLQRCLDDKASVRKAALVLMHKSTASLRRPPTGNIVEAMGAACGDALVSIRKAGLTAISEVLSYLHSEIFVILNSIYYAWLVQVAD